MSTWLPTKRFRRLGVASVLGLLFAALGLAGSVMPAAASAETCDQSRNDYQSQCLYVNGTGTYVNYIWFEVTGYPYTNAYGYAGVDVVIHWTTPNGVVQTFDACGGNGGCIEAGDYTHYIYLYENLANWSHVVGSYQCFGGACDPGGPAAVLSLTIHS